MSLLLIIIEVFIYNKRGSLDLLFVDTQSIILYKLCTLSLMISCMNITIVIIQKRLLKINNFLYESNFFICLSCLATNTSFEANDTFCISNL